MRRADNKQFWNRTARIYKKFTYGGKRAQTAYQTMVHDICRYLDCNMAVLELAAGPGVLSAQIASNCKKLEATDFSQEMIAEAKRNVKRSNLHFSVQDATNLPYQSGAFDAVVIANALHIMPKPALALKNIGKVLKENGILICPTFTRKSTRHGFKERLMELAGFHTYSRWTDHDFQDYIKAHGFQIVETHEIEGHNFPITFLVAKKDR